MTWLKKIGMVALKVIGIASGLLPLVAPALSSAGSGATNVVDRLKAAFDAVITAEQMFTAANGADAKTGSQKLAAATPFVAQLVEDVCSEFSKKDQPKDATKFTAAVTQITAGLADALNAYGE
jgi:hypothetical protein